VLVCVCVCVFVCVMHVGLFVYILCVYGVTECMEEKWMLGERRWVRAGTDTVRGERRRATSPSSFEPPTSLHALEACMNWKGAYVGAGERGAGRGL
jgi:hypothetical protein